MIGSNFNVLTDDLDAETLRDVQEIYRQRAEERLILNAAMRQEVGVQNHEEHFFTDLGCIEFAPTVTDYFWNQRFHNETFENPDFVRWFKRQPEGEYSRVNNVSAKVQVGYTGERRVSFRKSYS